jgi:phosphoribosylformylglycinamidine synthase PurS subunit
MYRAKINITLRSSILDPQGKAVHHALENLGLPAVEEVRIGKFIELNIRCSGESEAKAVAEEACKKLLANPVMEDYSYTIEKIKDGK